MTQEKIPYKLIYLLGIGGIGMSALARYYNHFGIKVAGYDRTPTSLTSAMQDEGIDIHFDDNPEYLNYLLAEYHPDELLIIYTPAIPKSLEEFRLVQSQNLKIKKRAEVLGEISARFNTIAVAGTHGKTTTSSLITHILKSAGFNVFAFLGGITKNYNTNLILGNPEISQKTFMVVEADEYDRSFLSLSPLIAIITSIDADHLDIYGRHEDMIDSYALFAKKVKKEGKLIVKKNVDNTLRPDVKTLSYALTLNADFIGKNLQISEGDFFFDFESSLTSFTGLKLGIPGIHNVENAVAAIAAAKLAGADDNAIRNALASFSGVKRRFEYIIKTRDQIFIDDYAHHPEELRATITSVKKLFPAKKITGVFQPHLFTRTRDFANEFAESLDLLDEAILLDIYPAREMPISGVNSEMLINKMKSENKKVLGKVELLEYIKGNKPEVLLTLGAGDIDTLIQPIANILMS